jgi:hypothetical protein
MGNGWREKPLFAGIDQRANAQGDVPKVAHASAIPARRFKSPRNRVPRRAKFTVQEKRKERLWRAALPANEL